MTQSPLAPYVGVGDTGFGQSRPDSTGAHTDGLVMVGAGELVSSSANLVLTRTANGRWALQRTAAGAETYYVRTTMGQLLRTGEAFQYGDFGGPGIGYSAPPYPAKGMGFLNAFAAFQVGVAALTSATLRIGTTVYSATVAPVQTDLVAATALATAISNPAAPLVQSIAVPLASQAFATSDLSLIEVELAVVMAATGTLSIEGLGAHFGFNYN